MDYIDWQALESRLFELSVIDISHFARAHADETFYGFAFDCNADYGQVLQCLNTEQDLRSTAEQYKAKHPDWYADKSVNDLEDRLRWSTGDWKYQDFNSEAFEEGWSEFEDLLIDNVFDEQNSDGELQARFLDSVCRVAVRLLKENAFEPLSRTASFQIYVADHDEVDEASWNRLRAIIDAEKNG